VAAPLRLATMVYLFITQIRVRIMFDTIYQLGYI
jgi:hypothetical protein